jgi:hypothetical protein
MKAFNMFDGKGVADDAYLAPLREKPPKQTHYDNYKLALLILGVKVLKLDVDLTLIEGQLWLAQKGTGGITSWMDINGQPDGTANGETTAFTLLAYDDDLINKIQPKSTFDGTNISVLLQGGSRTYSGWIVPFTVKFFTLGFNVMNTTPIYTFDLFTAKFNGNCEALCTGVTPGKYDITAVSEHTLLNVKRNIEITSSFNSVNLGTLLEGNANKDDRINILDFGILATAYGKNKDQSGYNAMADFDRNGAVNIFDFGLLATNYLKMAPVEVP